MQKYFPFLFQWKLKDITFKETKLLTWKKRALKSFVFQRNHLCKANKGMCFDDLT